MGKKLSDPHLTTTIQTVVFVLILIITPFYLWRVAGVTDKRQIIIATVSFLVWTFSLGGPFQELLKDILPGELSIKFLGAIIIMIYTLIVPMFYKPTP